MVLIHQRVHIDNVDLDSLIAFTKSNSKTIIIVKEQGLRPHIHCIIEPVKTLSTYRQKLLLKFPTLKGNKSYSLEEVRDIEKMKAYCCKGDSKQQLPNVLYSSDIDVEKYHQIYWEVNSQLKTTPDGGVRKEKTLTWIQQVRKDFSEQYPSDVMVLSNPVESMWKPTEDEVNNYIKSKKSLLSFILKSLGKTVKVLDDNIVLRIFRGVHNSYIQEGSHTDKYVDFMYDKLQL